MLAADNWGPYYIKDTVKGNKFSKKFLNTVLK